MNYWEQCLPTAYPISAKKEEFGGAAPKKLIKATPFALVINASNALLRAIKVLE